MGYALGVDLGTTYTAAAVARDGRVEIASLGNRASAIPSVVLLREDETILTGDAASRRGATEPDRVAREFKRRLGDTTPIFLGGAPYSAEALTAKLLRWTTDEVAKQEGSAPESIAVTHPANWGPYKTDLLGQSIRLAGLDKAEMLTEPEAAAIYYASTERIDPGDVIAVYDLGGGTFDAAVLRKTESGFEILGQPEGIERLGGIDFDAAVFAHVARSLDGALEQLDEDDPTAMAAVTRLRQECVDAKEGLSTDTDVSIPVLLPGLQTEVRLTRTEFESMVRPTLTETIAALHRALRSAQVDPADVKSVLLVGGSSRIPLVSQLVGAEVGRPVAIDAHPKHAIALGAALHAAGEDDGKAAIAAPPEEGTAAAGIGKKAAVAGAGAAAGVAAGVGMAAAAGAGEPTAAAAGAGGADETQAMAAAEGGNAPKAGAGGGGEPPRPGEGERFFAEDDPSEPVKKSPPPPEGGKSRKVGALVAGLVVAGVVAAGGGVLLAQTGGGGGGGGDDGKTDTTEVTTPETEATTPETSSGGGGGGGGTSNTTAPTTSTTTPETTTTPPETTTPDTVAEEEVGAEEEAP